MHTLRTHIFRRDKSSCRTKVPISYSESVFNVTCDWCDVYSIEDAAKEKLELDTRVQSIYSFVRRFH